MELDRNSKAYLSIILFIIPIIVLSAVILSVKIETSNLKNIISSHDKFSSECYNLTYSFINEKNSDKNYISLHSYLKSFQGPCTVIIIIFSIKIFYTIFFTSILENMIWGYKDICLIYVDVPGRIISFIPVIICIILLGIRIDRDNCEVFMNYYNLCSAYYGDNFKKNFANIMNIIIYAICIAIIFVLEIIYHAFIFKYILDQ